MFLFLVFNDPKKKRLCAWYKFSKIRDVIAFTNNLFRYSDVTPTQGVYATYKQHFQLIKLTSNERYRYFKPKY